MKIAIPLIGFTSHGGVRVLVQIANSFAKQGHIVTFFLPKGRNDHIFKLEPGIEVKEIGPNIKNKLLSWISFSLLFPFYNTGSVVIANHFITYFPSVFARNKKKVIYFVQGLEYQAYSGVLTTKIASVICKFSYYSDGMYAANKYLYDELKKFGNPKGYLQLGIADDFIKIPLEQNKWNARDFDIIYFLRAEKYKRLDRFDAIIHPLLNAGKKIVLVSQDINLLEKYKQYDVTCARPENDTELIKYIDQSKLMVLTSDFEGFSLPPLECMARGVPPILYDCGGPKNYAKDMVNSIILDNVDEAPILDAIMTLLSNEALLEKLSKNARLEAERFNYTAELERFTKDIMSQV